MLSSSALQFVLFTANNNIELAKSWCKGDVKQKVHSYMDLGLDGCAIALDTAFLYELAQKASGCQLQ